jgi:hypothetical protein
VVGGGVTNVDPLVEQQMNELGPNSIEQMDVITAGAGVEFGRAQGGFARAQPNPPRRVYIPKKTLARRFVVGGGPSSIVQFERQHLLRAAWRVLADLAEDGRLSAAEGIPSLAALLAAQRPDGAITADMRIHAIATWALAEASAALAEDRWVERAARSAGARLGAAMRPEGWARVATGPIDAETTAWCALVLGWIDPERVIPASHGAQSEPLATLLRAFDTGEVGAGVPRGQRSPFERLLAAIPLRHLKIAA